MQMNVGANSRRNKVWLPWAPAVRKSRIHSDGEIAEAAAHALRWRISSGGVSASVDDGWVTLSGLVETSAERTAAEKAVYYLLGVRGIRNQITVNQAFAEVNQAFAEIIGKPAAFHAAIPPPMWAARVPPAARISSAAARDFSSRPP